MADVDDGGFEVRLELTGGGPGVVASGELDIAAAPAFSGCLHQAVQAAHGRVWVDMAGVTFLDSSGLGVLARVATDVVLEIRNASPNVRRVLDIARLDALPNVRLVDPGGSQSTG
jgi:anti-anti-sigma factor